MYLFLHIWTSVTFKVLSICCNAPIKIFFPPLLKSCWTHWFWGLLVLLLFFCFASFSWAKCFPLRTFFIQGNKIKSLLKFRSIELQPFSLTHTYRETDLHFIFSWDHDVYSAYPSSYIMSIFSLSHMQRQLKAAYNYFKVWM